MLEEVEVERFLDVAQRLDDLRAAELLDVTVTAPPGLVAGTPAPEGLF